MSGYVPKKDSDLTTLIKQRNGVIFGCTNVPEFAANWVTGNPGTYTHAHTHTHTRTHARTPVSVTLCLSPALLYPLSGLVEYESDSLSLFSLSVSLSLCLSVSLASGHTRNPYNHKLTVGGSSGGSASAVASYPLYETNLCILPLFVQQSYTVAYFLAQVHVSHRCH